MAVPPEGMMLRPSSASVAMMHRRPCSSKVSISTNPYKSERSTLFRTKGISAPPNASTSGFAMILDIEPAWMPGVNEM
jgi:hypothetical protein